MVNTAQRSRPNRYVAVCFRCRSWQAFIRVGDAWSHRSFHATTHHRGRPDSIIIIDVRDGGEVWRG
jgi:hypothetical protein